jgi:ATP adenylyltransferase
MSAPEPGTLGRLWAVWRMRYIDSLETRSDEDDIFAELPKLPDGPGNLIVHRGRTCYVVLNLYPYNTGHSMVVPFRAVAEPGLLSDEEALEMMRTVDLVMRALRRGLNAQGFNLGMNLGKIAGAGIPNHLHFHVVPRWSGDTNFMPVVGETKVIPESLEDTYRKVRRAIEEELRA